MIIVSIRPRQDDLFDIWVTGANGETLLNSSQGYERAIDAEDIARKVFGAVDPVASRVEGSVVLSPAIELTVTYRDGTTKTERLR